MQVILLERVERLGIIGEVVKVKPGFARNFLLPQGKALRATKENMEHFERQKAHIEAENIKNRDEARKVADKLEGTVLTVIRQAGQSAQLYGSVTAKDISDTFKDHKVDVNRQQVKIDHPIKMLGLHEVKLYLHPEVHINITVNVAQSEDEAKAQLEAAKAAEVAEEAAPKKSAKAKKSEETEEEATEVEAAEEEAAPKKKAAASKSKKTEEADEEA